MTGCGYLLGTLPCDNASDHKGHGLGCTHTASWAADRHTSEVCDD